MILECDALNVVCVIHNRQEGATLMFLLFDDIIRINDVFNIFCCVHMRRAGNTTAHLVLTWKLFR